MDRPVVCVDFEARRIVDDVSENVDLEGSGDVGTCIESNGGAATK